MLKFITIAIIATACTTDAPAKLPSCADVGCPGPTLCAGVDAPCSCVAAPGDAPVACERNPGIDAGATADVSTSSDASTSGVVPDGTWAITYNQSADNCGNAAQVVSEQIAVTGTVATIWELGGTAGNTTGNGSIMCSPNGCEMVELFPTATPTRSIQLRVDLMLDADGHITGSGSYSFTDQGVPCMSSLTVTSGVRS